MLKFVTRFKGMEAEYFVDKPEIIIGRKMGRQQPDVCLNMDVRVLGEHARFRRDGTDWWIEPLHGRGDICVNDNRISQPMLVTPHCRIRMANTELWVSDVEAAPEKVDWKSVNVAKQPVNMITDPLGEQLMIHTAVKAGQKASDYFETEVERDAEMVATIGTLPSKLAEAPDQRIASLVALNRLINTVQGAERGAVMLRGTENDQFEITAAVPKGSRPYSRALTQRAFSEQYGFIWQVLEDDLVTESIFHQSIASGMYTSLIHENEIIGALCVDNSRNTDAFSDEDLHFFMSVAQAAAPFLGAKLYGKLPPRV